MARTVYMLALTIDAPDSTDPINVDVAVIGAVTDAREALATGIEGSDVTAVVTGLMLVGLYPDDHYPPIEWDPEDVS